MAGEGKHPFIDNGKGFPTGESVRKALDDYKLGVLADTAITFRGEKGSVADLIAQCKIEHLTQDWPKGFISKVIGAAAQAGQKK